jgi:HEAT repeat protein
MLDPVRTLRMGGEADRAAAARWLAENPSPEAYPALVEALQDSDPDVICWAAGALGRLGNPEALEPMRQALVRYCDLYSASHNAINKPCMSGALELLMRSAPTPTLVETLRRPEVHSGMRVDAARILGERRAPEAFVALVEMLDDPWWAHSVTAAEALAEFEDVPVLPHLERAWDNSKQACARGGMHWDQNRELGLFLVLLRCWSPDEVGRLHREGDAVEQWHAGRELERRGLARPS